VQVVFRKRQPADGEQTVGRLLGRGGLKRRKRQNGGGEFLTKHGSDKGAVGQTTYVDGKKKWRKEENAKLK